MMPLDADDIAAFYDTDMPGYVEAVIDGELVGALDRRQGYAEAFGLVAGSSPSILVADSIAVVRGAIVVIAAESYVVSDVRNDVKGRLRLIMESA